MKFNLRKYLTEKLQSDIIVNDLLKDSGGFFKYYKHINDEYYDTIINKDVIYRNVNSINHQYDKLVVLTGILTQYLNMVFYVTWRNEVLQQDTYRTIHNDNVKLTDEKRIKLHQQYMKYYDMWWKCLKLNFTKPSTEVLIPLLHKNIRYEHVYANSESSHDISNISDDMFDIYTYDAIKKDKILYSKLLITNDPIFWLSENNEILGYSFGQNLRVLGPSKCENPLPARFHNLVKNGDIEDLKNNVSIYELRLNDGTVLEWPTITEKDYYNNNILNIIKQYVLLDKNIVEIPVGKFMTKSSKLYKTIQWGDSIHDYVIVYKEAENNNITNAYKTGQQDKKEIVQQYVKSRGKWVKDVFGNTYPYGAMGKSEKSKKFESFINKFFNDIYCSNIYQANQQRYKTLKTLKSVKNDIDTYAVNTYNELVQQMQQYTDFSKQVINDIKSFTGSKKVELLQLFGAYSYMLNDNLCVLTKIQELYNSSKEYYKKLKDSTINNDDTNSSLYRSQIDSSIKYFKESIQTMQQKYIPALKQLKEQIENFIMP